MPLPCPVCKAENAAGPNCRRCKADLSLLFALEEQRPALLARARAAFAAGDPRSALQWATQADRIYPCDESRRWQAMLHVLFGNFGEAWRAYRAMNTHGRNHSDR